MGIEELCNKVTSKEISKPVTASTNNPKDINLESLYRELMEEKLIELNKYIKLNRYLNMVIINRTALEMDGYQITIN